jgi:hypothetical protein
VWFIFSQSYIQKWLLISKNTSGGQSCQLSTLWQLVYVFCVIWTSWHTVHTKSERETLLVISFVKTGFIGKGKVKDVNFTLWEHGSRLTYWPGRNDFKQSRHWNPGASSLLFFVISEKGNDFITCVGVRTWLNENKQRPECSYVITEPKVIHSTDLYK